MTDRKPGDMITALHEWGFESLELAADGGQVRLSESAARMLGTGEIVSHDELRNSGPDTQGDGTTATMGHWLSEALRTADSVPLLLDCGAAGRWVCLRDRDVLHLVRPSGNGGRAANAPPVSGRARHEMRNQLNNILMNAELIALLASRHGSLQMLEPARRIVDACRQCRELIENQDIDSIH